MRKFLKDNSLSIIFGLLFVLSLFGQGVCGWKFYNGQRAEHQLPQVSYGKFLETGTFWDAAFTNWQAAVLQLACLIIFSEDLYQRGASHSKNPDGHRRGKGGKNPKKKNWIYRNSLSLAFVGSVCATFILHVIFGTMAANEDRAMQHQPPLSVANFFISPRFWFLTLQTWEAEFFAILVFIVFTIFLRQQGSPESKPTGASDKETGETNK